MRLEKWFVSRKRLVIPLCMQLLSKARRQCGKNAFAIVAKATLAEDQSIPTSMMPSLIRRDGTLPTVHALHIDTSLEGAKSLYVESPLTSPVILKNSVDRSSNKSILPFGQPTFLALRETPQIIFLRMTPAYKVEDYLRSLSMALLVNFHFPCAKEIGL